VGRKGFEVEQWSLWRRVNLQLAGIAVGKIAFSFSMHLTMTMSNQHHHRGNPGQEISSPRKPWARNLITGETLGKKSHHSANKLGLYCREVEARFFHV